MQVITDTAGLEAVCAELARAPFVAIDTEFLRETTYWPKLCLVQAAGGAAEAVIDPLAPGIDLAPLNALLANEAVVKVFHAARQDLEIFLKLAGKMPAPVFDTQIAAMAAGFGESVAYDALVQGMLKRRIDKSHRFTDWSRRPLSEAQLAYALADVTHLRDLYPKLHERLERAGRLAWVAEEMAGLVDLDIYDTTPENAWRRLKPKKHTAEYLTALKTVAEWRERTAQARDVPRGRILKDDALYEVAEQRPRKTEAFDRLRAVPKGFGGSRHGAELAALLDAALAAPEKPTDLEPPRAYQAPPSAASTIELLRVLLRAQAEKHDVASRLIATAADLEAIAVADDAATPALEGWRREVFGALALDLKHGRIALTLTNGRVSYVRAGLPADTRDEP